MNNLKQKFEKIQGKCNPKKNCTPNHSILKLQKAKPNHQKPYPQKLEEEDDIIISKMEVYIRIRPLLEPEIQNGYLQAIFKDQNSAHLHYLKPNVYHQPSLDSKEFKVDKVFSEIMDNNEIYRQIIDTTRIALDGGKGCILAYGQTGSGKTFTMNGIQMNVARDLFKSNRKIFLGVFEILGDKARDLITDNEIQIFEDKFGKVQPKGLKEYEVGNSQQFQEIIQITNQNRKTSSTFKNTASSRTHQICSIRIQNTQFLSVEDGFLYLIDLMGSENTSDSQFHDKQRFQETKEINKSLMALKECIRNRSLAAVEDKKFIHIPYRNSKLTLLLKEAFELSSFRKCRTVVIATVAPTFVDQIQTNNTLNYAVNIKINDKKVKQKQINPDNPQFWDNLKFRDFIKSINIFGRQIDMDILCPFETGIQMLKMPEEVFIKRLIENGFGEKQGQDLYMIFWQKFIDVRNEDRQKINNQKQTSKPKKQLEDSEQPLVKGQQEYIKIFVPKKSIMNNMRQLQSNKVIKQSSIGNNASNNQLVHKFDIE